MKHKTKYDTGNNILHIDVIGKFSLKDAQKLVAIIKNYIARFGVINMMCDMEHSKGYTMNFETKRLLMAAREELKSNLGKVALVGAGIATGLVCKVIFALSSESKTIKFFMNRKKAVAWLRVKEAQHE